MPDEQGGGGAEVGGADHRAAVLLAGVGEDVDQRPYLDGVFRDEVEVGLDVGGQHRGRFAVGPDARLHEGARPFLDGVDDGLEEVLLVGEVVGDHPHAGDPGLARDLRERGEGRRKRAAAPGRSGSGCAT
ncbi:hypothetical protein ACIBCA_20105 [Kitasatospora sp. NPDC051170]|uniref:hypothetical protein n=1 Tax=Kitasatospora sp. NPDC051170 TaxID=3364056 RepID=UPI003799E09C